MEGQRKSFYQFGSFRIDRRERLLLRDGEPVPLPPKVYDTLLALVIHSGHLVEKEDLMKTVWPDTFVEEANLTVNISALRKILSDGDPEHHYIETVPRRGYRFISPVTELSNDAADSLKDESAGAALTIEDARKVDATNHEVAYRTVEQALPRSRSLGLAVIGIAIIVGLGAIAYFTWMKRAAPAGKVRSIAVLPSSLWSPTTATSRLRWECVMR